MAQRTDQSDAHMPSRSTPLAEAQLVILYMLKQLGSATDANLLDFLTEARIMNYIELMPALGRLSQEGSLSEAPEGVHRRYSLNSSGEELLQLYGGRIPFSVKEEIDRRVPEWQASLRAQRDFQADMAETPRGDFDVSLRMMERGRAVMTVTIELPSSEIAARLCRRWRNQGGDVYRALIEPLMKEETP